MAEGGHSVQTSRQVEEKQLVSPTWQRACSHITSCSTIPAFQKHYSDSLSPYSPDLTPCDFFLFPKMKLQLKGRCFDTTEEIHAESQEVIETLTFENLQGCMKSWETCWDRCILRACPRRRWKLGVTVRNFFMVKFPEFSGSPRYYQHFTGKQNKLS